MLPRWACRCDFIQSGSHDCGSLFGAMVNDSMAWEEKEGVFKFGLCAELQRASLAGALNSRHFGLPVSGIVGFGFMIVGLVF